MSEPEKSQEKVEFLPFAEEPPGEEQLKDPRGNLQLKDVIVIEGDILTCTAQAKPTNPEECGVAQLRVNAIGKSGFYASQIENFQSDSVSRAELGLELPLAGHDEQVFGLHSAALLQPFDGGEPFWLRERIGVDTTSLPTGPYGRVLIFPTFKTQRLSIRLEIEGHSGFIPSGTSTIYSDPIGLPRMVATSDFHGVSHKVLCAPQFQLAAPPEQGSTISVDVTFRHPKKPDFRFVTRAEHSF